jgi:hypothetical protein
LTAQIIALQISQLVLPDAWSCQNSMRQTTLYPYCQMNLLAVPSYSD